MKNTNKQYTMGATKFEGVEVLRNFLNSQEQLKEGGIQRSLSNLDKFRCEGGVDVLLGEYELQEGENRFGGEFELPIFDFCNEHIGTVRIYGTNVVQFDEECGVDEEQFIIEAVELA